MKLLGIGLVGVLLGFAVASTRSTGAQGYVATGAVIGVRFSGMVSVPPAAVTKDAAISDAVKTFGALRGRPVLSASYGLLSNDQMYSVDRFTGVRTYVAQDRPVWLLAFGGMDMPSRDPRSSDPAHHELDVVIDGKSGDYLFAYSVR